jgi:5-formyltetrahydrofolate cyclo-ligase
MNGGYNASMEDAAQEKAAIRRQMRALRRALSPEERLRASKIVCAKLNLDEGIAVATDPFDGGGAVAVYLASPDEIDLSDFIREMLDRGVEVASPRWNGETYELARLKGLSDEDLRCGPMNILEPAEAEIVKPQDVSVWIVPGLAFTKDGKRLGYGGGWYDRLLAAAAKDSLKIGVAHEFQIVDDLPSEQHDILLDHVVTATLSDRHLEFTETPDGFRASVSVDSLPKRRAFFAVSLVGLCLFPVLLWFAEAFTNGRTTLPAWAGTTVLVALALAILASAISLIHIVSGPEVADIEVKGEEGVCRRWFLGRFQRRPIRFRWSPWSKAQPFGRCHYSAPTNKLLAVLEGGVEQSLFRTYASTEIELEIRMNLAHQVAPEKRRASAEAILAVLPRGMRIIRDGLSETIDVKVHSLTNLWGAIEHCGILGIVVSIVILWLAAWKFFFIVLLPIVWGGFLLFVAYHALWTLFGRHRLTITGINCDYEARLGPRINRECFPLGEGSRAICFPVNLLSIIAANGTIHDCFHNLPPRCYLPLIAFIWKHAAPTP